MKYRTTDAPNNPLPTVLASVIALSVRSVGEVRSIRMVPGSSSRSPPPGAALRTMHGREVDGRFVRVQCKTGRLRDGVIRFNTVSTRSNRTDVLRRGYEGEVDAFAIWCPQNEMGYFVPVADLTTGIGTLRVAPAANNQRRGVRWAEDYALPAPRTAGPRTGFEPATPVLQERCSTN